MASKPGKVGARAKAKSKSAALTERTEQRIAERSLGRLLIDEGYPLVGCWRGQAYQNSPKPKWVTPNWPPPNWSWACDIAPINDSAEAIEQWFAYSLAGCAEAIDMDRQLYRHRSVEEQEPPHIAARKVMRDARAIVAHLRKAGRTRVQPLQVMQSYSWADASAELYDIKAELDECLSSSGNSATIDVGSSSDGQGESPPAWSISTHGFRFMGGERIPAQPLTCRVLRAFVEFNGDEVPLEVVKRAWIETPADENVEVENDTVSQQVRRLRKHLRILLKDNPKWTAEVARQAKGDPIPPCRGSEAWEFPWPRQSRKFK